MLLKILHIVTGWGKRLGLLPTTRAERKLVELRVKICSECPFSRESKILAIVNGEGEFQKQLVCTKCGCPSWEKGLVIDEKCPEGKW